MSVAITCTDCTGISYVTGKGFSAAFETLKECYEKVVNDFRDTETLGRPLHQALQSLEEVFKECSEDNWDGYNAHPMTEGAYYEAVRLFEMLPSPTFLPDEVTPEPDGSISLEWYKGKTRLFAISLSGRNEIVYAGIFGPNEIHGTVYFGASVPKRVMENLKDLLS
ncbi:MAG: hypothetical protein AABY58_04080 [Nitrospirota bacterium]